MKFASSERITNQNLNFFPGPGHYDFGRALTKGDGLHKKQKPVPKTAFVQCSDRFNRLGSQNDLGPGYYFGQSEWQSKKSYKDTKAQFYPNPRKIITIPSIPSSTHAMGYVEREDGYLIPLNSSSIKDENDLGPGAYETHDGLVRKKVQSVSLNMSKSPRFPAEKIKSEQKPIILGNYTIPKKEIPSIEPQPKREPPRKSYKDEEKVSQEKIDENPGLAPGYYYNEKIASSFKVQAKPLQFQNFGTTSKRFQSITKTVPGPGFYSEPKPKDPYVKIEPFAKGDQRFREMLPDELPGPGTYTGSLESNFASNNKSEYSSQTSYPSAFGTGVTRFVSPKSASDLPGPGSYNPFKNSKKNKKRKVKPSVTSLPHNTRHEGTLFDLSKDLVYAADLELGGRSKGAVIVKHEEPANKGTSAFQSSVGRFQEEKEKRSITPGPGNYHSNQSGVGVKPTFNILKTNFTLTPREHETKGDVYKKMLGPGFYDYQIDIIKPKINHTAKINPAVPNYGALLPK